ncbi:hypothetical protein ACL9RF_17190 [Sphingobacterium sp. Mn56C]
MHTNNHGFVAAICIGKKDPVKDPGEVISQALKQTSYYGREVLKQS